MNVRVTLAVEYVVHVETANAELALKAVSANWDSIYKHQARAVQFPPELSGRILDVTVERSAQ